MMKAEIKERIEQVRQGGVPKGYKHEFSYRLPIDWSVVRLGKLTARTSRRNKDDEDIPACSINNQIGFVPQSEQFDCGSYVDLEKTSYKVVLRGEFAYNPARINVGSIGRLKHAEKAIVSSLYVCFKLNGKHNGIYFEYWFESYDFYKEVIRNLEGSVREYLFYENFSNARMPLPSISEQEKIAEILTHCDKVIKLKKQLIDEKRLRKKWMMQKLLNPESGLRLPGFAGKWSKKRLGTLCTEILDGDWIESKDQSASGIRLIQTGNVGIGSYMDKAERAKYISEDTFRRLRCTEVFNGDILVSRLPDPVGRVCKISELCERAITVVDCSIVRFKSQSTADYFIQYACSETYFNEIAALSAGSTRTRISRNEIEKLAVWLPEEARESSAIANILCCADRELDFLEQEIVQWQLKKKSMMQLLLTGIVRANV